VVPTSNGEQPAIGLVHYKMDEFENREGGGKSVHGSGRHHRSPTIISARRLRDGLGSRIPAMPGRARRARSPGLRCQSARGSRQQKGINPIHQSERDEPRPPRAQPCAARNRLGPVRPRAPYVTAAAWRLRFALFPVASGARRPEEPIVLLAGRVAYARGYAAVWGRGRESDRRPGQVRLHGSAGRVSL
jgi:hypothetical protein